MTLKIFVLYSRSSRGERVQLVTGMDFFNEKNGFSSYDIDDIENMSQDGTLNTGSLKIWRVK